MFSFLACDDPDAPGVGVAFTDRADGHSAADVGPLNLGRTDIDDLDHLRANVDALRARLGIGAVATLHQVHGADVVTVDADFLDGWDADSVFGEAAGRPPLRQADALVTTERRTPPVALCIRVADCVPVLLADATRGVIGAAHAGRVGFDAGVLGATVAAMRERGAEQITAWIGPHICGSCYEVPAAMRAAVAAHHPAAAATTRQGTPALDLGAGCQAELASLGVRVHRVDPCTLESVTLHSHRRDGARAGRLAGLIWLR